mmetsp:Transcript_41642/g.63589  ORF Transcript_41642/g.63589 Transcript_41642/m.63589 type:complete len:360 (+) Transcript_41642:870-1949(+)
MRVNLSGVNFTDSPGTYQLVFGDPDIANSYTVSKSIDMNEDNIWTIRSAVYDYFVYKKYTDIEASITRYDVNDTEIDNFTNATKVVIDIKCLKLSTTKRVGTVTVIKSTTGQVQIALPDAVQLSSPPLSGKYKVKCIASDGTESISDSIAYNSGSNWVNEIVMRSCSKLYDKLEMYEANDYRYTKNGRSYFVRFIGLNDDPGQFEIIDDPDSPLTGNNITFINETIHPFSHNIFYEPVPYELLRTYETKPQVLVSVDGHNAACPNLDCDFEFIEAVGEITSFTYTEATKLLSIVGTALPTEAAGFSQVEFAKSNCTIDASTITATGFSCTLDNNPTCGSEVPAVISAFGLIPNAAAISP